MDGKIFDAERAEEILSKCKGKDGSVDKIKLSNSTTKPPVPFNLGGLQAEAYNVFNFSPKKTQTIAQNLYTAGYTSYPRTSSQKLPESLDFKNIFNGLKNNKEFKVHIDQLPSKLKPNEGKKEDAAHPAIHPTGILPDKLDKDELKVYQLIVYRFISVFFEAAKFESMNTTVNIADELFSFKRRRVTHKGWMEHYPYRSIDNEEFPNVKEGDTIAVEDVISEEKETKPPARYNQASLIKELEKRELGTKATRADIIAKLEDKKKTREITNKKEKQKYNRIKNYAYISSFVILIESIILLMKISPLKKKLLMRVKKKLLQSLMILVNMKKRLVLNYMILIRKPILLENVPVEEISLKDTLQKLNLILWAVPIIRNVQWPTLFLRVQDS